MTKKATLTISVSYDLANKLREEYLAQLDDNKDTKAQRKWFAIDRLIGEEQLKLIDPKAKVTYSETATA